MIRIVVAHDQMLVRKGFALLLDSEDDIEVVGEARDGAEAVELARRLQPDVVLMDVRMPGVDGIEATERITREPLGGRVRVLVITTYEIDEYVFRALRAGASTFFFKDTEPAELVQAVGTVAGGDALLSPKVTRSLIAKFVAMEEPSERSIDVLSPLTDREREVMAEVARGLSNDEIAEDLVASPTTVRTHVSRAMMKLHARDRAQLVVLAYESGLISAGRSEP